MGITDTPFFNVLRERMGFLNERQKLLAENVANASTPKYVPRDLDNRAFADAIARLSRSRGTYLGVDALETFSAKSF